MIQLTYELPRDKEISWSELFDKLERLAQELNIADYSLSQTTLEQIFLQFSKEAVLDQDDSDSMPNGEPKPNGTPTRSYDTYV